MQPTYMTRCENSVREEFENSNVAMRFDVTILIPLVMQLLSEYLGKLNCGKNLSPRELAIRCGDAKQDVVVKLAIREAVRQASKQHTSLTGQEQSIMRVGLREAFVSMPLDDRVSMCRAACLQAYGVVDEE